VEGARQKSIDPSPVAAQSGLRRDDTRMSGLLRRFAPRNDPGKADTDPDSDSDFDGGDQD